MIDDLERLTQLWNDGALSKEEFEREKGKLLGEAQPYASPSRHGQILTENAPLPPPRKRRNALIIGGVLVTVAAGVGGTLAIKSRPAGDQPISAVSETVPAELADASWASGDCSARDKLTVMRFEDGHSIERLPSADQAERQATKYEKTKDGWKIINANRTEVMTYADGKLKHAGFEVAGEFIATPQGIMFQRCSKDTFAKVSDAVLRPVKEPLRYALSLAMDMKDAKAVERIVAKMPSVEGGINGDGDPNGKPDIDTMLSITSPEIVQIIQRKRGKLTNGKPQDSYAISGQPWQSTPNFPAIMQGDFIPPDRVGGCSDPFLRFHVNTYDRSVLGAIYTNTPSSIATSGNRVWVQNSSDKGGFPGGIVYMINQDGTMDEIVNLTPSGVPDLTSGKAHYSRCTAMPAATASASPPPNAAPSDEGLAAVKLAYANSTAVISSAWQALSPDMRQSMLASQRAWIKQKTLDCKNLAAQTPGTAQKQEVARLQCEIGLDKLRIQELRRQ